MKYINLPTNTPTEQEIVKRLFALKDPYLQGWFKSVLDDWFYIGEVRPDFYDPWEVEYCFVHGWKFRLAIPSENTSNETTCDENLQVQCSCNFMDDGWRFLQDEEDTMELGDQFLVDRGQWDVLTADLSCIGRMYREDSYVTHRTRRHKPNCPLNGKANCKHEKTHLEQGRNIDPQEYCLDCECPVDIYSSKEYTKPKLDLSYLRIKFSLIFHV